MSERVEALRAGNADVPPPGRLPPAATRSAFVEVLLDDLAAAVPAPLAAPLRAADSPGTALDWLFAGAVYRAVADDPYLARQFLALVADDPRAAGVAMATALASRQEPPPRSAAWHRRDRLGLALQLGAAALVLVGRLALFVILGSLIRPTAPPLTRADILPDLFGLGLFAAANEAGLSAAGWLAPAVVWAVLEASPAPRFLEGLRRLPAKLRGEPPPPSWRADAFPVLWCIQAVLVLLVVLAALSRAICPTTGAGPGSLL